ncbi:nitrate reductase [Desulfosporosinus sp. FKB]|uniref:nitrate reductase n=1 Tax=Desulfosporosinus sp. FKB TaxID=1969835 RepID=UPI000B49CE68|nr:nitrate reductase [Desulfosporosinus sp. FKB]
MKKPLILTLVFLITAYAVFRGAYWVATLPASCTICHEAEPYYEAWKESPHKNVPCMYCHEKRGPFGKIENVLTRGFRGIGLQLTGEFGSIKPGYEALFINNCITCHIDKIRDYKEAPLMPNDHIKILKSDTSCNNCHRDTGHKSGLGVNDVFKNR